MKHLDHGKHVRRVKKEKDCIKALKEMRETERESQSYFFVFDFSLYFAFLLLYLLHFVHV